MHYLLTSATKCPAGSEVDSEADCRAAAAALPGKSTTSPVASDRYPKGCFIFMTPLSMSFKLSVNTASRGRTSPSSDYAKICKTAAVMPHTTARPSEWH